jgi:hypothetical protein
VLARADLVIAWSGAHRSGYGAQYAWRDLSLVGNVNDTRSVAPWAQLPIVDAARPQLDIAPALTRNLLSLYAEHTWRPVQTFSLEGGGRAQYDVTNLQASGSARLAAALSLPTLTVLKLSGGAVWQPYQVPLALDPVAGNRQLKPERSVQLIAGLEQPLPFEALVRLEGWAKWLGDLVVNPDTRGALDARLAAGLPAYTNAGFGHAYGIDGMLVGRTRHFSYTLGLGVLSSVRTNPLAVGVQTYPVQWEQRFTGSAGLSWSPNSRWVFTARANFRTGRPYTPVLGFSADFANERWVPVLGATSSQSYPFLFDVTNTMNVYAYVYGAGDFEAGTAPTRGRFTHLPIRPFLGLRAGY